MQSREGRESSDVDNERTNIARRRPAFGACERAPAHKGYATSRFCRHTGFDQGLLSKILSSVVTTLNVETVLKLAEGLGLPPTVVFDAIGKRDIDDLLQILSQQR